MKSRLEFEKDTVYKMILMYCKGHGHGQDKSKKADYCAEPHQGNVLCEECSELFDYATERLARCPFGEEKTFCSQCPVHCYTPLMREKIKKVMAWSGPRMIFYHPIVAGIYLIKKRRHVSD